MNPQVPALEENVRSQRDTFHEYLRVLRRHLWPIVGLTLLFAALGALNSAMKVPIYWGSATMQIEREAAKYVAVQEIYGQNNLNYEYYQTQYEVLKTRPLAERVVDKVGVDKLMALFVKQGRISMPWRNAPVLPTDPKVRREMAIGLVHSAVRVDPVRNSQLVRVGYEVADPAMAAELANQLVDSYIENNLESRLQMVSKASNWLAEKSSGLKTKVDESQSRLSDYLARERVSVAGLDTMSEQNVQMLIPRVAEARADRLSRESMYQQVQAARKSGRYEEVLSLAANEQVSGLRTTLTSAQQNVTDLSSKYGPQHPAMQAAKSELEVARKNFNTALAAAAENIVREYETARSLEQQLQAQLTSAQMSVQSGNRKSLEVQKLQRDIEANLQIYEKFLNQQKETGQLVDFQTSNARLIESASINYAPISPDLNRGIIIAALLGLALAMALAFLLEHLDNTIKTIDDVERHLALPVLGMLPQLKEAVAEPARYFLDNPRTHFSEAVRTVRTGVLLSTLSKAHRRILVTSSVPSEGKTTLSLNLAQAMSQVHKVLLIDADLRRPSVAKALHDKKPIGLSQFIAGEAKISECVTQIEGSNTYVMSAGTTPPNPLELLSSAKFVEALDNLGKAFDFIILDCAPLIVSDGLVLSRLVDGVIYVVRGDHTPYQAAQGGVRRLQRSGAHILGVVLNRVGERSHGYGYGRYSYYAEGYNSYGYYGTDSAKK